jgi:hypothetical protein
MTDREVGILLTGVAVGATGGMVASILVSILERVLS